MASNGSGHADLSAVLQTLSQFATPTSTNTVSALSTPVPNPSQHHQPPQIANHAHEEYQPSDAIPSQQRQQQTYPYGLDGTFSPHHPTNHPSTVPATIDSPDPSKISSWPAALQHVMRAVAHNEALQHKLRRLIRSQHDHERQWWRGREALLEKQKARVEKKRQLDEVLKSVGVAPVDRPRDVDSTDKDNAIELRSYDTKVYQAAVTMSKAMETELYRLKIPFFFSSGGDAAYRSPSGANIHEGEVESAQNIQPLSADELLALRRRMLEFLQDLCGDEIH